MAKWIGDNSQAIGKTDVRSLSENYYCVSAWRLLTGFRLMEGLMTVAAWTFIRPLTGLGLLRITEERPRKGRVRMVGDVNVTRLLMVLRKLRPLKRVVEAVLPVIIRKMGPRLLRLSLTKTRKNVERRCFPSHSKNDGPSNSCGCEMGSALANRSYEGNRTSDQSLPQDGAP